MLVVALAALALAGPPPATITSIKKPPRSPCDIIFCRWFADAAATRVVRVHRGATVRVTLAFDPTDARLTIAGRPQAVTGRGHELDWRATRSGGISLRVTSPHGWVTYFARLAVN